MKIRSRFSYFRDKLQVFILGFLLGIVLGGGFFLLKLDSYVKELSFYKSLTQKDDKDENDLQPVKDQADQPKPKKPKDKPRNSSSAENLSMNTDSLAAADTSFSQGYTPEAGGDEIVIRKDEMLDTKSIAVSNLDMPADSANAKTAADNGHYITIEFWKSPLNYRGYKFSRSRLVLFGFETADVAGLYKSQNSTYLKTSIGVFRLEASSDFHQLERVTDESLIARMQ